MTSSLPSSGPPMPRPSHPLFDRLWRGYAADVAHAGTFARLAGAFENDHIALRTLRRPGDDKSGIELFAPVFERLGYVRREGYRFPDVHLSALYLSAPGLPRVFVSELDATKLPAGARDALWAMPQDPPPPAVDDPDALAAWFAPPSRLPSRAALDLVAQASQYGAWLLLFGRRVNHFTAAVDDVALWQRRLLDAAVPMKRDIEGAPFEDGVPGLQQTATAACAKDVTLGDGSVVSWPYAYFEIAARRGGFDGFLAPQARNLFDMTGDAPLSRR